MKIKFVLLAVFLTAIGLSASNAQNIEQMPMITTTGAAEVRVVPDEVIFTLEVEKTNKDLQKV